MFSFKNFLAKHKKLVVFISLSVISFFLMVITNKTASFTARKVVFSIIYPFQFTFSATGDFVKNTFNSISELKKLKEELNRSQKELEQFRKIIIDFNELNNENNNLKKLLELKQSVVYDSTAAEIIGRDPQRLCDVLIINRGSTSGIKENMPVISYSTGKKILVGKIVEVTPFASKVLSINNINFSCGALIVRNRVHCIVQGNNETPGVVKLLYIPKQYVISDQGMDFVYTSGDSVIFPQGLEIGKIIKINPSARYEVFNEGLVQISVDLSKLEYVLVLKVDVQKDNYKILELPN
ncbi:MAG: rod shape-determining protein MreC [Spirochaetes bacterium GWD1_27_9]|nr:MAG: rod shape-determining protein MreC [Spirochaetes bacterium GWB1_27_13]OHD23112.1 MAG: rod shape-determining protein MreC [Spirochaetes bacterium GWC1_27_15]OHD39924.1 MAG: rod shape-determining protein MreC [Spirochaetes bacterium GWD1_27_9]